MANVYNTIICSWWIFLLVAALESMKYSCLNGLRTLDENDFEPKPKGTLKTIEVSKDGYLIDCVDIYKQPSLDNQPMKDLQMKPTSSYRRVYNKTNSSLFDKQNNHQPNQIQNWHRYGQCPKGTIPIRRNWNNNGTIFPKHVNDPRTREYATAKQRNGSFHGAGATFSVWNPHVSGENEFSVAQLWIASGEGQNLQTIEVGWQVYPKKYRSPRTMLFIFWTNDGYQSGCYNYECKGTGFRQTHAELCVGCPIEHVSVYGLESYELRIVVQRDSVSRNWWLYVDNMEVGYFPRELFTNLGNGADRLEFGGEIVNHKYEGRHTSTQMGSGHFSAEGFKKASYIRNIEYLNPQGKFEHASLFGYVTKSQCYDIRPGQPRTTFATYFYYGGPGYSPQGCP